jgi:hypothetical protein
VPKSGLELPPRPNHNTEEKWSKYRPMSNYQTTKTIK